MLARHGQKAVTMVPIHLLRGDANTVSPRLIGRCLVGTTHHVFVCADCMQHAQTILPNEDPGAKGPQFCIFLMHANCPATAMQSDCSSEPSKACASDLCMHDLC